MNWFHHELCFTHELLLFATLRCDKSHSIRCLRHYGGFMKENKLIDLSKSFAIDTINLYNRMKKRDNSNILINQLLKSGTSIGANIYEGNYAASTADFINKFQISLKECYETDFWLDIFRETDIITDTEYKYMYEKCSKIRRMLIASINTAKKHLDKQ